MMAMSKQRAAEVLARFHHAEPDPQQPWFTSQRSRERLTPAERDELQEAEELHSRDWPPPEVAAERAAQRSIERARAAHAASASTGAHVRRTLNPNPMPGYAKASTQYVETALWSSTDDEGTPLDQSDYDLSDEALDTLNQDVVAFMQYLDDQGVEWRGDVDAGQLGHDFWLTRNQHGAGFWDRGLGELGKQLTDAAHSFGKRDLYIGDDGLIYVG
jgi:hypothetical protein